MSKEKTRYSDSELDEFKEIIQAKIENAKKKLKSYRSQMATDNPDQKLKGLDDGTGTAEMERLTLQASREEKFIKQLDNALIRIDNKIYGVCSVSGKLISKERLKLVPHTTKSIHAKNKQK